MNEPEKNEADAVVEQGTPEVESVVETASSEPTPLVPEPVPIVSDTASVETTTVVPAAKAFNMTTWFMARRYTILAVVLVVVALLGLTYLMEQQGRLQTGIFDGVNHMVSKHKAVARVNDSKISQRDLDISVSQISVGAELQGVDVNDPEMKADLQSQALDMLINTELLKQEAAKRDITITEADIDSRLDTLTTEVGGQEVLAERMKQFSIDQKTLRRDVRNELTIQTLLNQVFEEKGVAVSDEEIEEFYLTAGGQDAGLPALEEVRERIVERIETTKEQDIVTALIEELRSGATIEILL